MGGRGCAGWSGVKGGNGTTIIAYSIKYILKKEENSINFLVEDYEIDKYLKCINCI